MLTKSISRNLFFLINTFCVVSVTAQRGNVNKIPIVVVTDLYFPYQDSGDNFDLITAYALANVDLKAIILDVTDAFRKPVADNPKLWHDPKGPREAGIIPVMQLNYIFNRDIPFAVGPFSEMRTPDDKMQYVPGFQQSGINLLLKTLKNSQQKISIMSFGSARVISAALNRCPELFRKKVKMIYLSAGISSLDLQLGKDKGINTIPGGEWNVALDDHAFVRLLRSSLPITIFPCAAKDGAFVLDKHTTYWQLPNFQFVRKMDIKLQRYLYYCFKKVLRYDFLRAMDVGTCPDSIAIAKYFPSSHAVWETALWLQVSGRKLIKDVNGKYAIVTEKELSPKDSVFSGYTIPCHINVKNDGRFVFRKTEKKTNFFMYERDNPVLNQKAFQQALPLLYESYTTKEKY